MGRTLPSAAQSWSQEEQSFARFRRALRRSDQHVLDDLFMQARKHLAAAAYAAHILPFETILLAMLIEEHKEVMKLRSALGLTADLAGLIDANAPDASAVDDSTPFDPE